MRDIKEWKRKNGECPAVEFLKDIEDVYQDKFNAWIMKLCEHGERICNGQTIKKIKIKEIPYPLVELKIKGTQNRLYTLVTLKYVFLLDGLKKKSDRIKGVDLDRIIQRSKDIINDPTYGL